MRKGRLLRFLGGLLAIDVIVLGAFAIEPRAHETPSTPPKPVGRRVDPTPLPSDVLGYEDTDPDELARRVAAVYRGVRRAVGKNPRVLISGPREVGHDLELRVSLARLAGSKRPQGYPARGYCFDCPTQACRFDGATRAALTEIAVAFPVAEVTDLASLVGEARVRLVFVGSASAGPVRPMREVRTCVGEEAVDATRDPPGYDRYEPDECGAKKCTLGGMGAGTRSIDGGEIDDNETLACLRAFCLHRAAEQGGGLGGIPVDLVGEVAFGEGGAYRSAEVALVLKDIAHPRNQERYARFRESLQAALEGE